MDEEDEEMFSTVEGDKNISRNDSEIYVFGMNAFKENPLRFDNEFPYKD